jgi:renalase
MQAANSKALAVPWYVASAGFSALGKRLSEGLDVRQSVHLTKIETQSSGVLLSFQEGREEAFDDVLVTVPGPQASALVLNATPAAYAPCWSLTIAVSDKVTAALAFDALQIENSSKVSPHSLAWVCRETSKPGRKSARELGLDVWTLHASPDFSKAHLDAEPALVQQALCDAFFALCGAAPGTDVLDAHVHKWRFARALGVARTAAPYLTLGSIGVAGDAFGGPRVESAYLSGVALAGDLLRNLASKGAGVRHA